MKHIELINNKLVAILNEHKVKKIDYVDFVSSNLKKELEKQEYALYHVQQQLDNLGHITEVHRFKHEAIDDTLIKYEKYLKGLLHRCSNNINYLKKSLDHLTKCEFMGYDRKPGDKND